MDCFLLLWNNTHNFTDLAAISAHLWCRFQEKVTWWRQKASAAACYHIISVWGIFETFSATRDSIWIWIMTEKFALSIFLLNQRLHDAVYRCSGHCTAAARRKSIVLDVKGFQYHQTAAFSFGFVRISVNANTCQISIWVKNVLQLIGNWYKLPIFVFFKFHSMLHSELPLKLSQQLLLHFYASIHLWTFASITN